MLTRQAALQKYRQAIVEVNDLVKATLQVIEVIFELEKLTNDLGVAIEQISVDVYWAIITIVSLTTRIDCLTTESYVTYVHFILSYIIKPNYFIAMKILKCIILLII